MRQTFRAFGSNLGSSSVNDRNMQKDKRRKHTGKEIYRIVPLPNMLGMMAT